MPDVMQERSHSQILLLLLAETIRIGLGGPQNSVHDPQRAQGMGEPRVGGTRKREMCHA